MSFFHNLASLISCFIFKLYSKIKIKTSLPVDKESVFNYSSQQTCRKRTSPFISIYNGTLSIEAAILLPLFLTGCIFAMCFSEIFRLETIINQAMFNCSKVYAQYAGLLGKNEIDSNILAEMGISGVGIYDMSKYVLNDIGENYKNNSIISADRNKFSFYHSSISSEYIDLIVTYRVEFKVPFMKIPSIPIIQRCRFHSWSGKAEKESGSDDEMVYITPTGSVYHKSMNCTYLRLSIEKVSADELDDLRNSNGGKYYPCEKCMKKSSGESIVYITNMGTRYHRNLNCSELKRTIQTVKLSDVINSRRPCSRCA